MAPLFHNFTKRVTGSPPQIIHPTLAELSETYADKSSTLRLKSESNNVRGRDPASSTEEILHCSRAFLKNSQEAVISCGIPVRYFVIHDHCCSTPAFDLNSSQAEQSELCEMYQKINE